MEESVRLLLVGILEKLLTEAALLGCQLDDLTVIGGDTIIMCQDVGDTASATTELSANIVNMVWDDMYVAN